MLVTTAFLLSSCFFSDCKKLYLSNEEKEWFEYYEVGDSLFFKEHNDEFTDTVIVTEKGVDFTACNKIELGEYQFQNAWLSGCLVENGKINNDLRAFHVEYTKEQQANIPAVACYKSFTSFNLRLSRFTDLKKYPKEFVYIFSEKHEVESHKFDFDIMSNKGGKIISFNWSKNFGLVKYKKKDGKIYTLWKKG